MPEFIINNIQKNDRMGDIKLQSCDGANIFYSGEVLFEDYNVNYGDFANSTFQTNNPLSHAMGKPEEVSIDLKGENTIISGLYKDIILEQSYGLVYEIKIYVWYETEEGEI